MVSLTGNVPAAPHGIHFLLAAVAPAVKKFGKKHNVSAMQVAARHGARTWTGIKD